jgi:hypothetical protein
MIARMPALSLTRRGTPGHAWALAGGIAAAMAMAGWAPAHAGPSVAANGRSLNAEIRHDKAFVSRRYDNCRAFVPSPGRCPLAVAVVANGRRGHLIAVDITRQTGDDCFRGRVFFFNGEHFAASTRQLPPRSFGGVKSVRADRTARFKVIYWVSASAQTSCAMNGNAGTDRYVYAWNGRRMVKKSGTPPAPPKVIVGT